MNTLTVRATAVVNKLTSKGSFLVQNTKWEKKKRFSAFSTFPPQLLFSADIHDPDNITHRHQTLVKQLTLVFTQCSWGWWYRHWFCGFHPLERTNFCREMNGNPFITCWDIFLYCLLQFIYLFICVCFPTLPPLQNVWAFSREEWLLSTVSHV